jgi:hypothetical protein
MIMIHPHNLSSFDQTPSSLQHRPQPPQPLQVQLQYDAMIKSLNKETKATLIFSCDLIFFFFFSELKSRIGQKNMKQTGE